MYIYIYVYIFIHTYTYIYIYTLPSYAGVVRWPGRADEPGGGALLPLVGGGLGGKGGGIHLFARRHALRHGRVRCVLALTRHCY